MPPFFRNQSQSTAYRQSESGTRASPHWPMSSRRWQYYVPEILFCQAEDSAPGGPLQPEVLPRWDVQTPRAKPSGSRPGFGPRGWMSEGRWQAKSVGSSWGHYFCSRREPYCRTGSNGIPLPAGADRAALPQPRLAGCRRGERFLFVVTTSVAFRRLKPLLRTLSDSLLDRNGSGGRGRNRFLHSDESFI
jgi:hypothetical protein